MNRQDYIVSSGGWFKKEYQTKPLALLIASLTFIVGATTAILAIAVVVLWRVDGVIPVTAFHWMMGGIPLSVLLIAVTTRVSKREKEITLFKYHISNPNRDARKLY